MRHRQRAKAAGNSYPHPPTATAPVVDSTDERQAAFAARRSQKVLEAAAEDAAAQIVDAFAGLVAGWGVVGEGGDDGADAAGIEFVTSLFRPLRGEVGPGCVDGLGDVPEVAFGVEDVDDLDRN